MAQELSDKIRAAAQAKGIDPEVALRIAQAESSFNPAAKAKSSTAGGLFQVIDDTWKQYGGKPGKKFDADENIRVGTDIIADNTKYLQTVLGRAPNPAEVYAAHYFGPAKAKAFLAADPSTPISNILPAKAIKANPNLQGKTAGQVLAQLEGKVGGPAKHPAVSRETPPARTPAEEIMEPALKSGMTAKASGVPRETQLASLGPSYQAALALSFLADEDKTPGEKDIDNEPSVAEQWLAQTAPKPTLSMADISIKSPFGNTQAPVMMNEGGDVSTAAKMLREVVPMDLRTFGSTLLGSREPITEANFNPKELAAMQQAVDQAAARTGRPQKGTVQYVDYPRGEQIGPDYQPVGATLGRFSYEKQPDGTTVIRDRYDFYNEGRKENVEAYEKMGRGERAATVAGRMLKNLVTGDLRGVPNELADAYIGRQGRDVTIKLPVKRADGSPEGGEEADLTRPATVNPNIRRQGEAARRLAAMRDVNALRDPRTYAAVTGFFGVAPDEQGFSALHPDIAGIKKAGEAGFYAGTAAQVAPIAGQAAKMLGKLTGSALNERLLAGQSLTPGISTPAPIAFAVKPRGGVFGYTGTQGPAISKIDELIDSYAGHAKNASNEVQEFILAKAPKYFTSTFGTADDPLRTAIREKRLEPFGRDVQQGKLPPYLIDAAADPANRANLQARLDLEKAYDELTGIRAYALRPPGSKVRERDVQQDISEKMAQEGVPVEARNPPVVDVYAAEDFASYPTSSRMLRELTEQQSRLPQHMQQALQTGETIYDVSPNMALLSPSSVVEALEQVPANKLKNMSFPEALIQGTQALAPIRDYRKAVDLAERGAAVPRQALDMFTQPIVKAPSANGQWVQLTKPVATELEGKLMNHSVGGYGAGETYGTGYTGLPYGGKKAFDEGLVRVYSLRDEAGKPTITVEMAKGPDSDAWSVTQVRGRFNSEPQDKQAVFELFDKIDNTEGIGKIKPNTYTKTATGEDAQGSQVDWGKEYDLWKQSTSE